MTFEEFTNSIETVQDFKWSRDRLEIESGGVPGIYSIFSKWKSDSVWVFARAFETVEGLKTFLVSVPEDLYNKQDIKVLFVHCNNGKDYVEELLITGAE